jgi:hypothetical protein
LIMEKNPHFRWWAHNGEITKPSPQFISQEAEAQNFLEARGPGFRSAVFRLSDRSSYPVSIQVIDQPWWRQGVHDVRNTHLQGHLQMVHFPCLCYFGMLSPRIEEALSKQGI